MNTKNPGILAGIAYTFFLTQILLGFYPLVGIYLLAGIIVLYTFIAMRFEKWRLIALYSVLLPITTLFTIILQDEAVIPSFLIIYAVLHYAGLFYWINSEHPEALYRNRHSPIIINALMLIIGALLGLWGFALSSLTIAVPALPNNLIFLCIPFLALTEELIFRRLLLFEAIKLAGVPVAIIFTVCMYTSMQLSANIVSIGFAITSAIVLCIIYSIDKHIISTFIANTTMKYTFLILLAIYH